MGKHFRASRDHADDGPETGLWEVFSELVTKVNPLWSLLRPAHHVSVSSGCLPSEYLVADEGHLRIPCVTMKTLPTVSLRKAAVQFS